MEPGIVKRWTFFIVALLGCLLQGLQGNEMYLMNSRHDLIAMSSEILEDTTTFPMMEDINEPTSGNTEPKPSDQISCFPFSEKLEYPNDNENGKAELCRKIGCEWYPRGLGMNWQSFCFTPKDYGYIMKGPPEKYETGYVVNLVKNGNRTYFGNDAETLKLAIEFQSDYRIHFEITDGSPRWKVPITLHAPKQLSAPLYDVQFSNDPVFSFKIVRKSTGTVIFDTSIGGLTFSDRFLQIATKLPSQNLYGFGEHEQPSFKHNFDDLDVSKGAGHAKMWPMFSREIGPTSVPFTNFGGVHPYYTVVENDGNTHSVAIINSNAQEIQQLPVPALVYRTIGGILDFYIFMGPKPEETVQQFTEAVGRPFLPPYHSLGFHISRSPFTNFSDIKEMVERVEKAKIPFDTVHGGIGMLDNYKTLTLNEQDFKELPAYVDELKTKGIHFSVTADALISTDNASYYYPLVLGNEIDIWVKDREGLPVKGYYELVGEVHYPDFSKPSTEFWWKSAVEGYKKTIQFDGMNLDRNQPYNFGLEDCPENPTNNPPYLPKIRGSLAEGTICPDSRHAVGSHYDFHSLNGLKQSELTFKAFKELDQKRHFTSSKSTYHGSGQWTGHFFDNTHATWAGLQLSIVKLLQFNQFGIPLVGSNICTFTEVESISEELCLRWTQLGAFYPLARNHNEKLAQNLDPASFSDSTVTAIRNALEIRYSLLPHLYTLFYDAHTKGNTVVRSLWHEFSKDSKTYDIDRQFMWGRGLMVVPVLEPGKTTVEAYIPLDRWYDFRSQRELTERGTYVTLEAATENAIPILIRGYTIIPVQTPGINTKESRNSNFSLVVALCSMGNGEGDLFYDDGESSDSISSGTYFLAHYQVLNKTLTSTVQMDGYPDIASKVLASIHVLGAGDVREILVNGEVYENFEVIRNSSEVRISDLNLPINSNFTVTWRTAIPA